MTKITDNATFRRYVIDASIKHNTTINATATQIANELGFALSTIEGWLLIARTKPITARNAALVQAAIDAGRLPV